jgi:hypothetical protein
MNRKERKKKIYEELRADQPRYDDLTRRLEARLLQRRAEAQARRRASS